MALRPPATLARTRVALHFPDEVTASEVRSLGGSRLVVGLDAGLEVHVVVVGEEGSALHAETEWDPAGTLLRPGAAVSVSWAELNDHASLGATLQVSGPGGLTIDCEWPPTRTQRRSFRRCLVELPVWIVRTDGSPSVVEATTRDISGSGMAVQAPRSDLEVGEGVVAMVRLPERDLVLPAAIHWSRSDNSILGLRFERITQSDQDHLAQFVLATEAVRR